MKNITLFLMALLMSCQVMAQQRNVTGTVTDGADNLPMIGANVIVKGTTNGVITGIDGKFSLNLPNENAVLVFTSIGYKKQEVVVRQGQTVLNVVMYEDSELLDEVVVVGYGTMKKSDLSGASVSVGEDKIKGSIITNLDQALQGRAAGVTSVMTSGAPGSSVSIRVRGQATVNSNAEPLYVIDGVIFQGGSSSGHSVGLGDALGNGTATSISPMSTLNPSDIVSMEILKDASATAIYGAQGANGVVLITTKRGKSGEAKFSYEGMFGVQNQAVRLKMMNLAEYAVYNSAIAATTGGQDGNPEYQDPSLLGKGTDWQDAIFRNALMQQHTVSAQGGVEKVQYYVSGAYMNQDGTLRGSEFERYSFRSNLDAQLKSWLKLGMNLMYSNTHERLTRADGEAGVLTYSLLTPPDIPVYDVYGNYATTVREGYIRMNPIALADLDENFLTREKLNGNFFLDVTPIKNLTWHAEFGIDISNSKAERWRPTYDFGPGVSRDTNSSAIQNNKSTYWQLKNYITYTGNFGKHGYSLMAGQEAWESSWEYISVTGSKLPDNSIKNPALGDKTAATIGSGFASSAMASFFGRATYNYDDRYLATYTYRYDGSSNFGPENRWAGFHAFAGSWRFSNEKFFESLRSVINNGKFRFGWGQTGNSNIGGFAWGASISVMPSALGSGYRQSNIANPYVKWETQEQWNLGLDLGLFNDRVNLTVDFYDKTSKDMLMDLQLPSYMGTRGNGSSALAAPKGNYGTINNKGFEISVNTRNLTGKFEWDTEFQMSFNKNKLVALDGTAASAIEGYGQWNDVVSRSEIGQSLYTFYGYIADGIFQSKEDIETHLWGEIPSNGRYDRYSTVFVGDVKFRDLNNDGIIDDRDKTSIGSPLPKFTYGMTNTFRYKNIDVSIFLHGSYGNKVMNYLARDLTAMGYWSNQLQKAMGYADLAPIDETIQYPLTKYDAKGEAYKINNWFEDVDNVKLTNPNTKMSRAGRGLPYKNNATSTRYIEDGSYLRIKNITIGYTLPSKLTRKYKIDNVRIYANIQNLHTFTDYSGYDPEIGLNPQSANVFGLDYGRYPSPRVYSFGLNLSF
ncbi:TonB-dependent receptor [Bacteroides sp. 214]|uniref:SusC/RagA family TonB-linked outer membrane protein n=1 Tax=Bacteroides sp. 214 TaxID=2302935 RepID=UPI0013D668F4|nr:TonB-dependent receptor [Bacteroides sp. 214]NDW13690.1 TonB-dependent receptor [Bacteroides sp. 214]